MDKQQKISMMQREYEDAVRQLEQRTISGSFDPIRSETVGVPPLSYDNFSVVREPDTDNVVSGHSGQTHEWLASNSSVSGDIRMRYEKGEHIETIADNISVKVGRAVSGLDIYKAIKLMNQS